MAGQSTKQLTTPLVSVRHLGFDPECWECFLSQLGPRSGKHTCRLFVLSIQWAGLRSSDRAAQSDLWASWLSPCSRVTLGCTGLLPVGAPPERRTHPTSMNSAWTRRGRWSQCNTRWNSLEAQAHTYISPAPPRGSKFKHLCDGEIPELHRGMKEVKGVSELPHHFSSISSGGTLTKWLCCQ